VLVPHQPTGPIDEHNSFWWLRADQPVQGIDRISGGERRIRESSEALEPMTADHPLSVRAHQMDRPIGCDTEKVGELGRGCRFADASRPRQ
jgi:hypothetical protein